ncbi:MAG: glycosyltransferase family 39 protein [Deltaproteobacteria bacterium]|nr:glycosyltransferase family 39 protein [Deltaproteobacteria bacterium]
MKTRLSLGLLLVVGAIYLQTGSHTFIDFDDNEYVYENPMVRGGLSLDGVVWAFSTFWSANWHSITWLSHMVDVQIFGLDAGWHHLTNVALHGLNSVLLFLVLRSLTNAVWRSALVAALFAVHPQHVESVAWIAERKDVLSTFFWLLTMAAYVNFARNRGIGRYLLLLATYSLGLMSKPMLVTLPVVLLLLDYWPLGRVASRSLPGVRASALDLITEKLPLLALAMTSSAITYFAQRSWGAAASLDVMPLGERISNALVSAVLYVVKTIYPVSLAVFYPHPSSIGESAPVVEIVVAIATLIVLTALSASQWRARPWITVGWLWFLITLVPVIGLVKIGPKAMADRYT